MIPLYINPDVYHRNLLFYLKVKNTTKIMNECTAKDFDIYKIKKKYYKNVKNEDDYSSLDNVSLENYNMTEEGKLSDSEKKKIFRPFEIDGLESYCLVTELNTNNSDDILARIGIIWFSRVGYSNMNARWQAVSCATYLHLKKMKNYLFK